MTNSTTLYRKYRPQKFADIIGQKHIVRTLSNAVRTKHIGQAYLLTGPRGTGKTTLARIFAKTTNCLSPQKPKKDNIFFEPCLKCMNCNQLQNGNFTDVIEIDAASNTGVDNIRELRETAQFPPLQGRFKVYIIDEVHMLSTGAFNALLKILEEPPEHIIFILATTELHKVPETILSRCQRFDLGKFTIVEIIEKLKKITKQEQIKITTSALEIIALTAEGGMRDAESLLEQISVLEDKQITEDTLSDNLGIIKISAIEKMTNYVFNGETSRAMLFSNEIYKDGFNLEIFIKSWMEYLRKIMITSIDLNLSKNIFTSITTEQQGVIINFSKNISAKEAVFAINTLNQALLEMKSAFIPQLPLENAIITLSTKKKQPDNLSRENEKTTQEPSEKNIPNDTHLKVKKKFKKNTSTKIKKVTIRKEPTKKIDIFAIKNEWGNIIEELRKSNYSLSMTLVNSKIIKNKVTPNLINVVVRHSFHRDMINKPENKLTIKEISNKITGLEFKMEAITGDDAGIILKEVLLENTKPSPKEENTKSSQSSLLADAVSLMGGKIVGEN